MAVGQGFVSLFPKHKSQGSDHETECAIFIYLFLYFYLFISGCAGSLLLCAGFLQLRRARVALQLW